MIGVLRSEKEMESRKRLVLDWRRKKDRRRRYDARKNRRAHTAWQKKRSIFFKLTIQKQAEKLRTWTEKSLD